MRLFHPLAKFIRGFAGDGRANFGLMMAVITPTLLLAGGYGLNVAHVVKARAELGAALDAAVTSTSRDLTTGAIDETRARPIVEAFLSANSPGVTGANKIRLDSLIVDPHRGTVRAKASRELTMLFPIFGVGNRQTIVVESASLYSDKKIEVAMMLDVTGSMGRTWSTDKIGDLRRAATNAVEMLLAGQNKDNPRIRVALVPYAEAVNVGKLADDVVFVERDGRSDLPPRLGASRREIRRNTGMKVDDCATERKSASLETDFTDDAPDTIRTKADDPSYRYYAKVNRDDEMRYCPGTKIQPLTADADTLKEIIAGLSASGMTAGGIGVQWTYYMLSPNWRKAISSAGLGDGPADYDPKAVSKIAIIMTDGQFNTAFVGSGRYEDDRSRNNAEGLCDAMKKDGIEVFTIGFDLDNRGMNKAQRDEAKGVLKNCASPDISSVKHYYEASTGDDLDKAYKEIIRATERLYLTM